MDSVNNTIFKFPYAIMPIAVGSSPFLVCVDRNGAIWVVNQGDNSIAKVIDEVVETTIATTTTAPPYGMCVDRDNKLWITDIAMGKIHSIENGVVSAGITACSNPYAICADKDNAIWVTSVSADTAVKLVNGIVTAIIPVGDDPQSICVDMNNAIWTANLSGKSVSKIVNEVVVATIPVGNGPMGICIDKDNAIWVVNSSSNAVSKIVGEAVVATIPVGTSPIGICVDDDNTIYVANKGDGTISKIMGTIVVDTIVAGNSPSIFGDATGMQAHLLFNSSPVPIPVTINIDTTRVSYSTQTVYIDTLRKAYSIQTINTDTKRILAQNITPNFSQPDIGLKSISIQTGVQSLSDRFTLETVGKSFSDTDNFIGEVAGFSFSFEKAETRESISPMGTTYTVTGRPDMNNFLFGSVYIIYGSFIYNGGRVINATAKSLCAAIGVDASNITDFTPLGIGMLDEETGIFTIKEKSKKVFLDKLFGWSSEFAHRQIYYTNRNGKVVVNEVGKHTTVYDVNDQSKYKIENINTQRQRVRKFVDISESSNDDPPKPTPGKSVTTINYTNSPFSGSAVFGDSSLVYSSGLLTKETTSDSNTTYNYKSANSYAFNSSKNVLETKITLSTDNTKRSTTTYEYDIAIRGPYANSDVDVSLTSEHTIVETKIDGAWSIDSEHKTYHVPLGNGFFGQRVVEIDGENHTTVANSISRGSPGGLASMYTVRQYAGYTITPPDDVETPHDFIGELCYPVNIPVAEINIVNDLITIVNNMDNKIEETVNLSIIVKPGTALVDAVKGAITYKGNLYYIQTTSATINDRGTRQQISAIRWY
jgi:YVTN family beta-propeller protein